MTTTFVYAAAGLLVLAGFGLIYFVLSRNERFWPHDPFQWLSTGLSVAVVVCGLAVMLVAARAEVEVRPAAIVSSNEILEMDLDQPSENFAFKLVENGWDSELNVYEGSVILLNVWATWCAPCLEEIPALNRIQETYGDQGVVVVSLSDEPRDDLIRFAERLPMQTVSGYVEQTDLLPGTVRSAFEIRPTTYLIDRDGRLRKYILGARSYAHFERLIQPYL